ncbi:MAG: Uma2 family endonuclease [Gammaproteobacteria bacterium]|nr:Uma2 family endonuclease [Gammaproteobacteria bacterium]
MKPNPVLPREDPLYPSYDGLPLAENDWQLKAILDAFDVLNLRYLDRPDVYVSSDLLIYYEEGDPRKRVAPDVFVVFGAAKHNRMVYKLWEEPKAPDFVLEVASRNTWRQDLGRKRALYAELGVREYWLFDPKDEYFNPVLQGLVLQGRTYHPLPAFVEVENGARTLRSDALGLELWVENDVLRFRDPTTGEVLQNLAEATATLTEATAALSEKTAALAEEKAARRAAEARIAELEARLREP